SAQTLTVSPATLSFGDTWTDFPSSLTLTIENSGSAAVDVLDIQGYNAAFSLSDTAVSVPASGSVEIDVTFSPKHNIPHNTELVIIPADFGGNIAVDVTGRGIYPDLYYSPTQDLSEQALKDELTDLIDGHFSLGYSTARDSMFMINDNELVNGVGATQNRTVTAYTNRVVEGYTSRSDAQTNFNVNTEHTWPQSMFGSSEPMQSDMYHLFITDATANSVRSNLPFGNVTTADWTNGGSKRGGGVFEPRDAHKGKVARGMFYFITRHGNQGSFMTTTQENVLRGWHDAQSVTLVEQNRNQDISEDQGNRNPFIDHPEFTARIQKFVGTSVAPEISTIVVTTSLIDFGTVPAGETRTYDVILVADGNQTINVSSWELAHPAFSFDAVDENIAPGEDGVLKLIFSPTGPGTITESLNFSTDSDSNPTVSIPVTAGVTFTGIDQPNGTENSFTASVSNSELLVFWTGKPVGDIIIWSIEGKLLGTFPVETEGINRFNLQGSRASMFVLEWTDGSGKPEGNRTQIVSGVLSAR
ncbi:MAG: endonuclease I, partial [Limisphaerales bacterium]